MNIKFGNLYLFHPPFHQLCIILKIVIVLHLRPGKRESMTLKNFQKALFRKIGPKLFFSIWEKQIWKTTILLLKRVPKCFLTALAKSLFLHFWHLIMKKYIFTWRSKNFRKWKAARRGNVLDWYVYILRYGNGLYFVCYVSNCLKTFHYLAKNLFTSLILRMRRQFYRKDI